MYARFGGTCPACHEWFGEGIALARRNVGRGGREVWAHEDCEAAHAYYESIQETYEADLYATAMEAGKRIGAEHAAKVARWQQEFVEAPEQALREAERVEGYTLSILQQCSMDCMSELSEWSHRYNDAHEEAAYLRKMQALTAAA